MATGASRFDMDRFGAGAFRATPRQADLMIVAGTVTYKMASRVRRLYNMMPDPKFVIAMGACTTGGGPYFKWGYHVVKGVDLVVPVDVANASAHDEPPYTVHAPHPIVRPSDAELDEIAALLNESEAITIYAGAGCAGAHDEVVATAARLKAPMAHTSRGKDFVEYDNPYNVGMSGMIATGGTVIATRSFSLSEDIIFWTETTGTRPGVTIHCRAITITTGRFIPTATCFRTK